MSGHERSAKDIVSMAKCKKLIEKTLPPRPRQQSCQEKSDYWVACVSSNILIKKMNKKDKKSFTFVLFCVILRHENYFR
jgi:hypothetical protein